MQHSASGLFVGQTAPTPDHTSITTSIGGLQPSVSGLGAVTAHQQQQQQQQQPPHSPFSAMLPDRSVTATTIEDAYVSFILACNPAVSPSTDTAALREAFRTPPRSDGRSFSIFTLYQLICQLEDREIKTWAELALKLGVQPPDQDKGQSSQKIQQYAVRLKRWMHSMHVNAFFDYLMDRPHPYWTNIPAGYGPVGEQLRDGVAAKDDMALRALIPEIKPRRGRRRPDDDEQDFYDGRSPTQRQKLDDYVDDLSASGSAAGRWSAHSDGSSEFSFSHQHHVASSDMVAAAQSHFHTPSSTWSAGLDSMNTPLSAYPQSAIAPSTRMNYWPDEPRSAITPSPSQPSRKPGRRHGAKVVSSAWRSSGTGGSGKTRGRPPINRNGNHHALPPSAGSHNQDAAFQQSSAVGRTTPTYNSSTSTYSSHMEPTASASLSSLSISELPSMATLTEHGTPSGLPAPVPLPILALPNDHSPPTAATQPQPRSSRPSSFSLQVPRQQEAEVRLASPTMRRMADSMSNSTLNIHSHNIPTTTAHTESTLLLHRYDPTALEIPLPMNYAAQDPTVQHSRTPISVDTHSPANGTNIGSGTTGATSVTSETGPNTAVDMGFRESSQKIDNGQYTLSSAPRPQPVYSVQFGTGTPGDRTNVDELEAYFMTEIFAATWFDENDQRIPPCSVEEASALVEIVIEDLVKGASSKEAFLINLAALAGGKILMASTETRVKRVERTPEYTKYDCSWELRFGDVSGHFSITEVVEHARWKTAATDVKASVARALGLKTEAEERAEQPLPPGRFKPFTGVAATMNGGRMKFPVQGGIINAGGRYESFGPGTVPPVNPGLQNYTPNSSAGLNFGAPAGSQHAAAGGTATGGGGGVGGVGGVCSGTSSGRSTANTAEENMELAAIWEKKYRQLLKLVYKRDRQLDRARYAVIQGVRKTYADDDDDDIQGM